MLRCIGCGEIIQSIDESKPGYLEEAILEKNDKDFVICKRCFKIKNYNQYEVALTKKEVYYNIIRKVTMAKQLFVLVCDAFDLSSIDETLLEFLKTRDTIVVMNRIDIMPKSLNQEDYKKMIRKYLVSFKFNYKDLLLVSSTNKFNIDNLIERIEYFRKSRNVYLIGHSNVGKSTLLNALIKAIGLYDKDIITVSNNLATTLNIIEVPFFADNKKMYDTPGLVPETNLFYHLPQSEVKYFQATKEIKPRSYQLKQGNILNISNIVKIEALSDINLVINVSNSVDILKNRTDNDNFLNPNLFKNKPLDVSYKEVLIKADKGAKILFPGLGFIDIKTKGELKIKEPQFMGVKIINV